MTRPGLPRRRVLTGLAAALGLAGVAACSDAAPPPAAPAPAPSPPPARTSAPAPSTPPAPAYTGDLAGMALGAALANLAAEFHGEALARATQGRYGPVPGVLTSFLAGAAAQHGVAAQAWNELLAAAGGAEVTGAPLRGADERRAALTAAARPADVLALAADLETAVAASLVAQTGELTSPAAAAVGAGLAPVAAMRAATAGFLLGRPPGTPSGPDSAPVGRDALTV